MVLLQINRGTVPVKRGLHPRHVVFLPNASIDGAEAHASGTNNLQPTQTHGWHHL